MAQFGWIKLHREIVDHWIWDNPKYLKWWLTILVSVNFEPTKKLNGSTVYDCEVGECTFSLSRWANMFETDVSAVRRFFKLLQSHSMIVTKSEKKTTRITVCNYSKYQNERHDNDTIMTRQRHDSDTIATPIKERREIKKEKKENTLPDSSESCYPFESFWNDYGRKVGRDKCEKKYKTIKEPEREKIRDALPKYSEFLSRQDWRKRKDPLTYLNGKHWEDDYGAEQVAFPMSTGSLVTDREREYLERLFADE